MPNRPQKADKPTQTTFFAVLKTVPRGDGSFIVTTEAPQQWVDTKTGAKMTNMSQATLQDWARTGFVTARRCGKRKYQLLAEDLFEKAGKANNHLE